jgi:hypothetical protein
MRGRRPPGIIDAVLGPPWPTSTGTDAIEQNQRTKERTMLSLMRLKHVALVGLLALVAIMGTALAAAADTPSEGTLRFDVAEDMTRFVFDQSVAHEDGMPKHGSAFITQGYIYPAGTLNGTNGVLPDGSPEFPDKVLGEWTCRGWFVGDGAHAETGAWVITTQIYNFGPELGDTTLVTEGYEIADVGVVIERAITGGTGEYAGARGEAMQTFLGFNASEGVNLTFEVIIAES